MCLSDLGREKENLGTLKVRREKVTSLCHTDIHLMTIVVVFRVD